MARIIRNIALAAGLAATTALSVPASAAPPAPHAFAASRFDPQSATADHYCRWGCGGWGGGYGWRRNRVSAGDVVLGAVLIGGIAAIASSANRRARERDTVYYDRDPYRRDGDWVRRDDPRERPPVRPAPIGTAGSGTTSGLDYAASMCADEVGRQSRVQSVDNVRRDAAGWEVTGTLARGDGFNCRIGNDGRISGIDFRGAAPSDSQWSPDAYAAARERIGGSVRPDIAVSETRVTPSGAPVPQGPARPVTADRMPAYPGGPIPGEEIPENPPPQP